MPRPPVLLSLALAALVGCAETPEPRPNVLWVVWDTVRADRLSLYGHVRPTTPYLEAWARQGRVFDDCVSPGTITVSSHASFFTGLLPTEHGVGNGHSVLDLGHATFAELLKVSGYRTFLWSANPHISVEEGFDQGFDVSLHPWSRPYVLRAHRLVQERISPRGGGDELSTRLSESHVSKWDIKASGVLAREALSNWLGPSEEERNGAPYFAFLNYMEAHQPLVPPADLRARMMPPEDVTRSYHLDRSWEAIWSYNFGLREFSDDELRIASATYDAAIAELDELFRDLITHLEAGGHLENTIVAVTSDHGEHLGEHHLLDHQFSVYEPLARVPLVLYYPARIQPGREARPVMSHDLFSTLLRLCGIGPASADVPGSSLLDPRSERPRLTEYLTPFKSALETIGASNPDWDPTPWDVELRAMTFGRHKLVRRSSDTAELYDLNDDPLESSDLASVEPAIRDQLSRHLDRRLATLTPWQGTGLEPALISPEHRRRLQALGYLAGADDEPTDGDDSSSRGGGRE